MAWLVAILLAAGAAVITFRKPWQGLLLVVVVNPFDFPLDLGPTVYTNELVLTGLCTGWLAHLIWYQTWNKLSWREIVWVIPFLGAVLLSVVNAAHWTSVFKAELRWLEIFLLVWYIANAVKQESEVRAVVRLWVGIATLVSAFGIVQTLAGPEAGINAGQGWLTLYNHTTMRAYSTFGHSNQFAGYLILAIPVAFIQFIEDRPLLNRIATGAATLIMITALVFTFSRGAWIATTLVSAVLIYLNVPKKLLLILGLVGALGATLYLLNQGPLQKARESVVQRMQTLKNPGQDDSVYFRRVCFETAGKMFRQHPWVGFGSGEYDRNIRKYFDEKYYAWDAVDKHIHNLYLQVVIESGAVGLAAFLFWLLYCLFAQARIFARLPSGYKRQLLSALIAGTVAFLIHNNFDVLTIYARGIHFAIVLGLSFALIHISSQDGANAHS